MTACNSDKCHCPDCVEARREKTQEARLDSLETRVGGLERASFEEIRAKTRMIRNARMISSSLHIPEAVKERARLRAKQRAQAADYERERAFRYVGTPGAHVKKHSPRGKIYVGYKEHAMIEWRWQQLGPDKWQRLMLYPNREPLGPIIYRRYFTPDGNLIASPPKIVEGHTPRPWTESNPNSAEGWLHDLASSEEAHGIPAGEGRIGDVEALINSFKVTDTKEDTMSPLALSMLFFFHANPGERYPSRYENIRPSPADCEALGYLRQNQLITDSINCDPSLTERGKVFVEAVRALPLPVREPAPWIMPKA